MCVHNISQQNTLICLSTEIKRFWKAWGLFARTLYNPSTQACAQPPQISYSCLLFLYVPRKTYRMCISKNLTAMNENPRKTPRVPPISARKGGGWKDEHLREKRFMIHVRELWSQSKIYDRIWPHASSNRFDYFSLIEESTSVSTHVSFQTAHRER